MGTQADNGTGQDIQTPGRTTLERTATARPTEERVSFIRSLPKIMKTLAIIILAMVIVSGIGADTCQQEAEANITSSYCR